MRREKFPKYCSRRKRERESNSLSIEPMKEKKGDKKNRTTGTKSQGPIDVGLFILVMAASDARIVGKSPCPLDAFKMTCSA